MDPLTQHSNPFAISNPINSPRWPSSPLIKPHAVGAPPIQQPPIIWPTRSNPTTPQQPSREPRSPITDQPRRQNQPPPLSSSSSSSSSSQPNYPSSEKRPTKIRVTGIERNRRDLYIKFDAWVSPNCTPRTSNISLIPSCFSQSNLTTTRAGHCPNVSRAYKEFLAFQEALISNNPHTIVPPIPFPK